MTGWSPQTDGKRVELYSTRPFADLGGLPSVTPLAPAPAVQLTCWPYAVSTARTEAWTAQTFAAIPIGT